MLPFTIYNLQQLYILSQPACLLVIAFFILGDTCTPYFHQVEPLSSTLGLFQFETYLGDYDLQSYDSWLRSIDLSKYHIVQLCRWNSRPNNAQQRLFPEKQRDRT